MSDAASVDFTAVLFGLEGEFRVFEVQRVDATTVTVIIEQTAGEGPCPVCGVLAGAVKDWPVMRLKDLSASGQQVQLRWRKRRLVCAGPLCRRKSVHPNLAGGAASRAGD